MTVGISSSFTPLPESRSLADLQTAVLLWVGMPADDDTRLVASTGIRAGVNWLNSRHWRWALTYDDITFVVNQYDYSLPRDVNKVSKLELLNSAGDPNGRLEYKDPGTLVTEGWPATTAGTPRFYTLFDYHETGKLSLGVKPNQPFVTKHPTGRLWYIRNVLIPNDQNEHLDVPAKFDFFVELYAREYMAGIYQPRRVGIAGTERRELWQQLIRDEAKRLDWTEGYG